MGLCEFLTIREKDIKSLEELYIVKPTYFRKLSPCLGWCRNIYPCINSLIFVINRTDLKALGMICKDSSSSFNASICNKCTETFVSYHFLNIIFICWKNFCFSSNFFLLDFQLHYNKYFFMNNYSIIPFMQRFSTAFSDLR